MGSKLLDRFSFLKEFCVKKTEQIGRKNLIQLSCDIARVPSKMYDCTFKSGITKS